MYISHRWEYNPELYIYKCVTSKIPSADSVNKCKGCGVVVTDEQLFSFWGGDPSICLSAALNALANKVVNSC